MKAERLLATLLYLQARGRVTVAELADELEVSRRTARRDLEALAAAGVPVYPQRGRGGGWSLVGSARIELNGLTSGETRALFLVAGPRSASSPELRLALRKLIRALPAPLRSTAETAAQAVVVDDTDTPCSDPLLDVLRQAVLDGVQVRLGQAGGANVRTVHPLGLVDRDGAWHLVAGTGDGDGDGLGVFAVGDLDDVGVTDRRSNRPDGFDLARTWRGLTSGSDGPGRPGAARVRVQGVALPLMRQLLPGQVTVTRHLTGGSVETEVTAMPPRTLAARLAGLGAAVEVIHPPETRRRLASIAAELAGLYR